MLKTLIDNPEKGKRMVFKLIILGSILAAIKMLFQNYSLDEEYQIVMAYRPFIGDHLFGEMWEPHQASAFLCTLFIKIYLTLVGTKTGLVIFLRVCGTLIHLGIAFYLYKTMLKLTNKEYSFFIAAVFFNTIPKLIQLPEFGMMQVWFYVFMFLFLLNYYLDDKKSGYYIILIGLAMSLEILSYPTTLILFPCTIVALCFLSKKKKVRDCILFIGTCGIAGGLYCLILLQNLSLTELIQNIQYVFLMDSTHGSIRDLENVAIVKGIAILLLYSACIFTASAIVFFAGKKIRKIEEPLEKSSIILTIGMIAIVFSCGVQLFYWVVLNSGYEKLHIHIVITTLVGLVSVHYLPKEKKQIMLTGMIGSILCLVAVMIATDLPLLNSIPHEFSGALFGLVILLLALKNKNVIHWEKAIYLVFIIWIFTAMIGKGYTLRDSGDYNNIFQSRGILKYGPGIGTVSDYMGAYIYNSDYKVWQDQIEDGSNVLVVTNFVMSIGNTQYMFKDVNISHFSIVDPTTYDEKLLTYWKLYPDKIPDVIVMDCWFGNLLFNEDEWIVKYVETEFGYTETYDGDYIRIYKRK